MTEAEKIADIEDFLARTIKSRVKKILHEAEQAQDKESFSESEREALIDILAHENLGFIRQNEDLKKEILELENKLMIFERSRT